MTRHLVVALVLVAIAIGCSTKDSPRATPEAPSATRTISGPNARTVDVAGLLRRGTRSQRVVYGDMNGVAPEEIVVSSQDEAATAGGSTPRSHVDAFTYDPGRSRWVRIFDAETYPAGDPNSVLRAPEQFVSQSVEFLEFVDFARDRTPELVVGVQNFGASLGPLDLWVLSWKAEAFTTEFKMSTGRGGSVEIHGNRIELQSADYKPDDPGCCPSGTATHVIGYDARAKRIGVLSKTVVPTSPQPS